MYPELSSCAQWDDAGKTLDANENSWDRVVEVTGNCEVAHASYRRRAVLEHQIYTQLSTGLGYCVSILGLANSGKTQVANQCIKYAVERGVFQRVVCVSLSDSLRVPELVRPATTWEEALRRVTDTTIDGAASPATANGVVQWLQQSRLPIADLESIFDIWTWHIRAGDRSQGRSQVACPGTLPFDVVKSSLREWFSSGKRHHEWLGAVRGLGDDDFEGVEKQLRGAREAPGGGVSLATFVSKFWFWFSKTIQTIALLRKWWTWHLRPRPNRPKLDAVLHAIQRKDSMRLLQAKDDKGKAQAPNSFILRLSSQAGHIAVDRLLEGGRFDHTVLLIDHDTSSGTSGTSTFSVNVGGRQQKYFKSFEEVLKGITNLVYFYPGHDKTLVCPHMSAHTTRRRMGGCTRQIPGSCGCLPQHVWTYDARARARVCVCARWCVCWYKTVFG